MTVFSRVTIAGAQFIAPELTKYKYIVSTIPLPDDGKAALPRGRVRILGEGTEGTVMSAKEIAALRKKFAAEIAELKTKGTVQ